MTAEILIGLIEEMVDLKIQQHAEASMNLPPDLARVLQEKRESDHHRLDQIRSQIVRLLQD